MLSVGVDIVIVAKKNTILNRKSQENISHFVENISFLYHQILSHYAADQTS